MMRRSEKVCKRNVKVKDRDRDWELSQGNLLQKNNNYFSWRR